jgi:hypothetical protein
MSSEVFLDLTLHVQRSLIKLNKKLKLFKRLKYNTSNDTIHLPPLQLRSY